MESKIIQQEKNPFLHREEFVIEFKSESNPSFDNVKKALGKDDELVVVKKIKSNFGRKTFITEAVVYDSKEAKEKIERSSKKSKTKKSEIPGSSAENVEQKKPETEEDKKPAEAKIEKQTEEKPAEEKPTEENK